MLNAVELPGDVGLGQLLCDFWGVTETACRRPDAFASRTAAKRSPVGRVVVLRSAAAGECGQSGHRIRTQERSPLHIRWNI